MHSSPYSVFPAINMTRKASVKTQIKRNLKKDTQNELLEKFFNSYGEGELYIAYWNRYNKRKETLIQSKERNSDESHLLNAVKKYKTVNKKTHISIAKFWGNSESRKLIGKKYGNIKSIDRIIIDIDADGHRSFEEEELFRITECLLNYHIKPDYIISSGRGVQVIFLFDEMTRLTRNTKTVYDNAVKAIAEEIEHLLSDNYFDVKIDRLTLNSLYRCPGTYNKDGHKAAKILFYNEKEKETFKELCDELAVNTRKLDSTAVTYTKNPKKTTAKTHNRYNNSGYLNKMNAAYTEYFTDMHEGIRHTVIFCYARNIANMFADEEKMIECIDKMNEKLCGSPLSYNEIASICKSAKTNYADDGRVFSVFSQMSWIENKTGISLGNIEKYRVSEEERKEKDRERKKGIYKSKKWENYKKKCREAIRIARAVKKSGNISEVAREMGLARNTVKAMVKKAKELTKKYFASSFSMEERPEEDMVKNFSAYNQKENYGSMVLQDISLLLSSAHIQCSISDVLCMSCEEGQINLC